MLGDTRRRARGLPPAGVAVGTTDTATCSEAYSDLGVGGTVGPLDGAIVGSGVGTPGRNVGEAEGLTEGIPLGGTAG